MHIFSMKPETFLYIYMASCISVLVFNLLYILVDKYQKTHEKQQGFGMVEIIDTQIKNIENNINVSKEHLRYLILNLKKLSKLKVFENSMSEILKENSKEMCDAYLKQISGVFKALVLVYEKRDEIEQAYFSYLIGKLEIDRGKQIQDEIMEFLIRMAAKKNVYVRENALKALYSIGNKEAILNALLLMEEHLVSHSIKLLADGLLTYTGDRKVLATLLFDSNEQFGVETNLAIMQFIRFFSGDFKEEFLELMKKDATDKEIILETIRYFRRYPYEPAKEEIMKFLRYREVIGWEYAAMAAAALSSYPGEDTVNTLKEGLKASNWYVRYNCAEALIGGLKIPKVQLFDVYNANDRYAREILQYATEKRMIKGQILETGENHV